MNLPRVCLRCQFFGLLLLHAGASVFGAELVMEVIPLSHRTAEQVLPVIQTLVPKLGTVSSLAGNLVIRSTPSNLNEIKRVLAALDRAPRRLLITVRQDADREAGAGNLEGSGVTRGGSRAADEPADLDSGSGARRAGARVYTTQSATSDRNTQQVQVLEGNEASIRVGVSVPITRRDTIREAVGGRLVRRSVDSVEYRDILSGFTVRPQLVGDIVTLQLNPQHDTPGSYGRGSMHVQRISSTVSGRLGEWIEVGGAATGRAFESDGATYRSNAADASHRRVLVKVEALD